ncbi:MAG: Na+/H+ antiporter subunit D, partial [Actinomycetota bacterium]|nr:Na+/H+ antiporter subunit D [Actinomycetota bacterium]
LVVFGIKAALFPLFFWLPDSYPIAPSPITAIFAGLLTKVGIYAIIRTQTLFFGADSRPGRLLIVLAAVTMLVGVLGALAQDDVKRILSFTIVSQIGYLAFGLGLFTVAGVAAAVFSMVHHIVVTTALFLASGLIERVGGSSRLTRVGGMVRKAPLMATLFLLPALGMAGIPPLSGFVSKFALVDAGMASRQYPIVAVSLLVSLLTLLSMIRIWTGVFWNPVEDPPDEAPAAHRPGGPLGMLLPTTAVVACSLAVAAAAGPLYGLSERTARDLLDRTAYVAEVTRR